MNSMEKPGHLAIDFSGIDKEYCVLSNLVKDSFYLLFMQELSWFYVSAWYLEYLDK